MSGIPRPPPRAPRPLFRRVAIIGVGLIGGSLGAAIRRRRLAREVVGVCRRREAARSAVRLRVVDRATLRLADGVRGADLVVLAVPVGRMASLAAALRTVVPRGAIVTDVGSAKADVVGTLERALHPRAQVVGGHPLAGSERRGVRAARAELFHGRWCFVTRTPRTSAGALRRVVALWRAVGARVRITTPAAHDRVVAAISHLPHLAAVALVSSVAHRDLRWAGAGFRDTTRVASGDPELWRDICRANRQAVSRAVERYLAVLRQLHGAVRQGRWSAVRRTLARAKRRRDSTGERGVRPQHGRARGGVGTRQG